MFFKNIFQFDSLFVSELKNSNFVEVRFLVYSSTVTHNQYTTVTKLTVNFSLFRRSIPNYFLWMSYFSWFKYSSSALHINHWHGVENIQCTEGAFRCLRSGQNVLDFMSIDPSEFTYSIWMHVYLIVGWRVLAFLVLLCKSYNL